MSALKNRFLPLCMWIFPLLFFAYQFILRLWPGLMMHPIMEQFSIDATHFGLLAAFYYYGYAGMQIPVAVLLDRFGARTIVFSFAVICGLATLIFTRTNNFHLAVLSRFLIGAGSAVGFLGVSKTLSEWFPKERYARMIGFSFTFGLMGAIYGGKPVSLLITKYSWQNVALTLAVVSILIGCGAYAVLRSPKNISTISETPQFKIANFKTLLSSPVIWLLAISNLLMVGSLEGFADVWGVPYLSTAYGLDSSSAAGIISCIFFGMLIGGPLLAFLSQKIGNYVVITGCGLGMTLAFAFLMHHHTYNGLLLSSVFFCIGIMCCYQVIVFTAGSELVSQQYLGVTVAFLNCINMLGGSFFHTCIGKIMDLFWSGAFNNEGLKQYNLNAYHHALSIIPACALIGAAIIFGVGMHVKKQGKLAELK